jgi:integrase
MRGHIKQRSKSSYSIKISLGKDTTTGKYKSRWYTIKGNKKDAEKKLSELLHQLDTGNYLQPGKIKLIEYIKRWLTDYAKANLSPRGYERYESIARVHIIPTLGSIYLTQLRSNHIQTLYVNKLSKGLSAGSVKYIHTVLHKALHTALKWGLVPRNVADGVEIPTVKQPEMVTWNEYELNNFLETARSCEYYELFYIALFTGMRRSELLALRWQDMDLILGQIYVNRGLHHLKDGSYVFTKLKSAKSRRTIALPPSATLLLQDYYNKCCINAAMLGTTIKDSDLVFSTIDGRPLRPNTVSRAWVNLTVHAGVKRIRLHDARHTHASLMLKQGIHPKIVQERLGHASIQITLDTYSHVAPGLQEAAANRFDDIIRVSHNDRVVEKV